MVARSVERNWAWQKEQKGNQPWWSGSFKAITASLTASVELAGCIACQRE